MKMTSREKSEGNVGEIDEQRQKHAPDKHSRWSVNRKLVPLKMFFFFFYGASGSVIPFITIYLKYLKLSASETGLIAGLSMLLAMLMRFVIGMLADKMSVKKTALMICCLGFGASFFALWFVPRRVLSLELSSNSTSGSEYVSLNYQQHNVYAWVCFADGGQEICRYPASLGSYTCKIIEDNIQGNDSGDQVGKRHSTVNTETNFQQFVDADKHGEDIVTNNNNDISEKDSSGLPYLTQTVSYGYVNNTSPCFYMDSENDVPDTSDVGIQRLKNTLSVQADSQEAQMPKRAEPQPRPARQIYHSNMILSQRASGKNESVSCLLNCTWRLVSNGADDNLNSRSQRQSNDSVSFKRGQSHIVTPDLVFVLSFILLIIGKSTYSASTSLMDAVTYTILGPYSLKWGQQRLWGTVGTGVIVLSVTIFSESRQVESFTGLFIACLGLSILAFLTGLFKLRVDKTPKNKTFFADLKKLLSRGYVRLFLCKLIFYGTMCGTILNFTFWFLVDIGSGQITLGVCMFIYCASSVILLRYSRLVLHKLGHAKLMHLTLVAYAIRYIVMSFLTNAWMVLPVEILHGVTYSLFWAAASSTASIMAPPGTQATSQALSGAIYWDLGRGIGLILSGQLLQLLGTRWTFRAYGILCGGVLPVFWILDRTWPMKRSGPEKQEDIKEQDEKAEKLLNYTNINGFSLNNNEDKDTVLCEKITPVTQANIESVNVSDRDIYVAKIIIVVDDSEVGHSDFRTISTEKNSQGSQDYIGDVSSGENNSTEGDSNSSTSSKVSNRVNHLDQSNTNTVMEGDIRDVI